MPIIEGGYYIKARAIQDSKIADCPPHFREIWDWLIKESNYKDNKKIKRGSCLVTVKDIQEGLSWYVGYRKMTYSQSQCENATKWLAKEGMITKTRTTRGVIITICKYDTYQNPENYECRTERRNESGYDAEVMPNDKERKKEGKKEITTEYPFEKFWNLYDKKVGNKDKIKVKYEKLKEEERESIMETLPLYLKSTPEKIYRRHPDTYLNQRGWEDEIILDEANETTTKVAPLWK